MTTGVQVEFNDGRKLYFGDPPSASTLREVSSGSKVGAASQEQFKGALTTLADLIEVMQSSLDKVVKKPKTVEMEFCASLTADCNLWIVKGEGSAEFKVTLTWD
jgi:G:T/U-mismatch repair DNA glycosylase